MNNIFYIYAAGIISGIMGAMGLGGGSVLILYLTLILSVAQLKAQGINLIFFIPCALLAVIIYAVKGKINLKKLYPFMLGGLPGVALGTFLSGTFSEGIIKILFGAGLIYMGIKEILPVFKKNYDNETK